MRGEYILFRVGIDSRGTVFTLSNTVQVQEYSLDIIFILEEECVLNGLTYFVHLL